MNWLVGSHSICSSGKNASLGLGFLTWEDWQSMVGPACLVCLMAAHREPVELFSDLHTLKSPTSPLRAVSPRRICSQAHCKKTLVLSKHRREDVRTPVPMSSILKPVSGRRMSSVLPRNSCNSMHLVLMAVGTNEEVSRTGEWAGLTHPFWLLADYEVYLQESSLVCVLSWL